MVVSSSLVSVSSLRGEGAGVEKVDAFLIIAEDHWDVVRAFGERVRRCIVRILSEEEARGKSQFRSHLMWYTLSCDT